MRAHLFFYLIFGLFAACEDPEEFPARQLDFFDRIQSNGGVKFKLVTGAENKVISTSLSDGSYNVSSGQLNINAAGGSMTIAIRNIKLLWCNACNVQASGLIADTLSMYIHAGQANLQGITITNYLGLSALNMGTYKFSGSVPFFNVYSANNADVEAFDLVTDSTYVDSWAALAHTEIYATSVINVWIHSAGNVYYKGDPPVVRLSVLGTGTLIKK